MDLTMIYLGSDHAGFDLKKIVVEILTHEGVPFQDLGCDCAGESVHYPVYAHKVVQAMLSHPGSRGILICGTGLGMSIAANRFAGIRAALCHEPYSARMSRQHNDANLLVLGGRIVGSGLAREIVRVWLTTPFEGGRHRERLNLIDPATSEGQKIC